MRFSSVLDDSLTAIPNWPCARKRPPCRKQAESTSGHRETPSSRSIIASRLATASFWQAMWKLRSRSITTSRQAIVPCFASLGILGSSTSLWQLYVMVRWETQFVVRVDGVCGLPASQFLSSIPRKSKLAVNDLLGRLAKVSPDRRGIIQSETRNPCAEC